MEGKDMWKRYEGKKVFVILKSKRQYSGVILEVETQEHLSFITIKDKFGNNVSFVSSEIEVIEEEGK
jgi:small nuclear ribonucleoprotein (snRNP)-like protein